MLYNFLEILIMQLVIMKALGLQSILKKEYKIKNSEVTLYAANTDLLNL